MCGFEIVHLSQRKSELCRFILSSHFFSFTMSTPAFFDYATTYARLVAAQAFLKTAPKVLALAWALVATNPEAGVTSLLSTYCHWFDGAAASGVV